jgi:hypothetical protein
VNRPFAHRHVVFFGSSDARHESQVWRLAEETARRVAEAGWTVVSGGYGGVMEAAGAGAQRGRGEAVGVLCESFRAPGNRYLTQRIVTPDLFSRLRQLIDLGDAYLVFEGSTGTLVELAMVWELMTKQQLSRRPLICIGDYWDPIVRHFGEDPTRDARFPISGLPERKGRLVDRASGAQEVIELLEAHLQT